MSRSYPHDRAQNARDHAPASRRGFAAAFANAGLGLPWVVGRALGLGTGVVTAVTYEYGNTFLIVAGLLNFLVVLDAYDIGAGRK